MSYDIRLVDPETKEALHLPEKHNLKGGTYCVGGTTEASLNITYNYGEIFSRVLGKQGIRSIYGKTGLESTLMLRDAIAELKDDVNGDYWKATEGNARKALIDVIMLAFACPLGVWEGD